MTGTSLKAEREKQGLTIKDIENATSIRSFYIEAIENGNYGALPSAVYVKGFIRNYAEFLNLDAEKLIREYREEIGAESEAAASIEAAPVERAPFTSGSDYKERVEKSNFAKNIFIAAAVLIIAFVGSIYYFFGEDGALGPMATKEENTARKGDASPEKKNSASPGDSVPAPFGRTDGIMPNAQASPSGSVNVTAKFSDRCWMLVMSDGVNVFEGIAEPNETMSWNGKSRVVVTAGNAGAVEMSWNGTSIGVLGKHGDVVEKRFTRDKVEDVK